MGGRRADPFPSPRLVCGRRAAIPGAMTMFEELEQEYVSLKEKVRDLREYL
jgi:hypothetical protein